MASLESDTQFPDIFSQSFGHSQTNPKFFVLIANRSLERKIARVEYKGM